LWGIKVKVGLNQGCKVLLLLLILDHLDHVKVKHRIIDLRILRRNILAGENLIGCRVTLKIILNLLQRVLLVGVNLVNKRKLVLLGELDRLVLS
jgi:hypothetical protein